MTRPERTDREGNFQTYLPVGAGWVKLSGLVDGRRVLAWRFASAAEGRLTELKDVAVVFAEDDAVSAPAWSADGRQLCTWSAIPRPTRRPALRARRCAGSGATGRATRPWRRSPRRRSSPAPSSAATPPGASSPTAPSCGSTSGDKTVADSRPAAICAPDALSVSPDGTTVATLSMDATGARSILLIRSEGAETAATFQAQEPAPHSIDFSPDGRRLVLDRHAVDGKPSVCGFSRSPRSSSCA